MKSEQISQDEEALAEAAVERRRVQKMNDKSDDARLLKKMRTSVNQMKERHMKEQERKKQEHADLFGQQRVEHE